MINSKKLMKLARKWQKSAAIRRKRITSPHTTGYSDTSSFSKFAKSEKGCFVVYSVDQKRFLLPLEYLNNEFVKKLFNMAEEEFGLQSNGPLALPCDATLMEYAIRLIEQSVARDIERALLTSLATSCSLSFHVQPHVTSNQLTIYSF